MAKCAARALFLSHLGSNEETQQKQFPRRSKKHSAPPQIDRGPASQPNNLDLEGARRQSIPRVHGGVSGLRPSTGQPMCD